MNIGKARALFEQVASREYRGSTVGEYLEAVKIVLDMGTHNSISKKMIISVCKWLVEIAEKAVSPYRWIPVSERLPENSGKYLVSFEENVSGKAFKHVSICEWQIRSKHWVVTGCRTFWKAVAWMPLPEPYKSNNE